MLFNSTAPKHRLQPHGGAPIPLKPATLLLTLTLANLHACGQPPAPQGTLSPRLQNISRLYDGMQSDYWIYLPPHYDHAKPAALMVFQDGEPYLDPKGDHYALATLDRLEAQGSMPPVIAVFINPGSIENSPGTPTYRAVAAYADKWSRSLADSMRSVEYDTVSDRYARFLDTELLPEVEKQYPLRHDAYSRAITGSSSGGIAAFNAAWQQPESFSRVISWIGSFTAIQWHEDPAVPDGGQDYPDKVLREPHRNLRVWTQDGIRDMENDRYGSWPLANIRLANALKLKGYDFHFSFGSEGHSQKHGGAEFAEELTWLWRGYNPALTAETYTQEAAEAAKAPFRVTITNR